MNERIPRILARKYATNRLAEEDLFQEGMLAYMKAEATFNPERGVTMETYASRVIRNRFIDILRKEHGSTELDEETTDGATGSFSFDDEVNLIEIKKILAQNVSDIERAVFNSYIEGLSYDEMGKIFDMNRKKIDNTVQKVKKIIKSHI
ncbi:MAG: sigma-70 family RNA polymerase sigma factor [Christensenellaceae bacterium]|jgi:RNA polymerase sporulation-specific sigma factor|nr:sigma-70 family RNA polymerase sigma factor [Christensenellaceae bacterium]